MSLTAQSRTQSGKKILGEYFVGRALGEGTFGKVKLGTHIMTRQQVALKFVPIRTNSEERDRIYIAREQKIMKLLEHPHVVKLFDVIELPHKETTCLVLEYVEGGELFDYILANKKLSEEEAIRIFRQMVSAIEYLHANLVIHRDLKPENFLLDGEGNVKVNDFGLSTLMRLGGNLLNSHCGSPHYSPPEILEQREYIGPEVDVWALGVILFAMVTGLLPWAGKTMQIQLKNAMNAEYHVPSHVSEECKDLLSRMICRDPKTRASVQEVREHPWVNRGYDSLPTSCLPDRSAVLDPDPQIVRDITMLGYERAKILEGLASNATKQQEVVLYHLMSDVKQKKSELTRSRSKDMDIPGIMRGSSFRNTISFIPIHKHSKDENGKGKPEKDESKRLSLANEWHGNSLPPSSPSVKEPPGSPGKNIFGLFKKKKNGEESDLVKLEKNMRTLSTHSPFSATFQTSIESVKTLIENTLTNEEDITWKTKKKGCLYSCKVKGSKVKFCVELCKIEDREGWIGLRLNRSGGPPFEFKGIYERLASKLV